jgi:hypothetical protein
MNFEDSQLQKCYDHNLSGTAGTTEGLRQVRALIATYDLFKMLEGGHSARVHATMDCLLSPPMRPALRRWYQRPEAGTDCATLEFRNQLSRLAGEQLEIANENPHNPS